MSARLRSVLYVAAGLWVLIDVLRMWTPSLITIFGQAAETPAELIGAFALGCGVLPLVLLVVTRRRFFLVGLGILLAARVLLACTDGGRPQLWLASAGVVGGIWWLSSVLGRDARLIAPGIATGLALATVSHAALGTFGAVWRNDVWGWAELIVSVGLVLALWRTPSSSQAPSRRAAWSVFPALLLAGVLFANAGRASAVGGGWGLLVVSVAAVLAVGAALTRVTRASAILAAVVLVVATAAAALVEAEVSGVSGVSPVWVLPAYLVGLPALVHLLASAAARPRSSGPFAVAGGAVVWVALLFAYYAGYDLGYRADVLLLIVAIGLAVTGLAPAPSPAPAESPVRRQELLGMGVLAVAVAIVASTLGPWLTLREIDGPAPREDGVRVAAYNVRMGYGMSGRFEARGVARLLSTQRADVILLSEVDRGWLLNGGQDQLRILARMLGMHAAFGPAADPVWGDAILSRAPLSRVHNEPFPSYGAVTGAQALVATTTVRGQRLTVISTHLQPDSGGTDDTVRQARRLAALMTAQNGAVVAGGDLNTAPGSEAWRALVATGYADALAPARPLFTSRADDPVEEIDHLFVRGLTPSAPRAIRTQLSDHLPVLVDLR